MTRFSIIHQICGVYKKYTENGVMGTSIKLSDGKGLMRFYVKIENCIFILPSLRKNLTSLLTSIFLCAIICTKDGLQNCARRRHIDNKMKRRK